MAVLRAVCKYTTGDFAWEKTAHVGAHLVVADEAAPADRVAA